LLKSQIRLET